MLNWSVFSWSILGIWQQLNLVGLKSVDEVVQLQPESFLSFRRKVPIYIEMFICVAGCDGQDVLVNLGCGII